jgi:enamine deaminase RidA (YjgF/YER057c/UK114 family)
MKRWIALAVTWLCVLTPATARQKADSFDPEAKLATMGIKLGEPEPPIANYVKAVQTGNLIFLAGHGPTAPLDATVTGKVGRDLTIEQGYEAARRTAIALLTSLKAQIGDLKRVQRVVRVFGMVNAVEGFTQQPEVINGASDLLVAVFGERGRHARAAVGVASLPRNMAVEIEMVVEVAGS